ncbi:MAG TPA: DUF2235 domain-containing protein [Telluria sp.]
MAVEAVTALLAANRDIPKSAPVPFQDCRDVLHISVFFDGTGNNKDVDAATRRWSNIARLYESARVASQYDKSGTIYPIYISGVGTPFNGKAVDWLASACVWVEDGIAGLGAAAGGDRRMEQGLDMVNGVLRDVLIANANSLGNRVAKHSAEKSEKGFDDLGSVLAKHRLIKVINLSFFGFSRGAALARAFSNRVVAKCTKHGESLHYHGYPLRLSFMGVFDTVASFGVPAQNARTPFTDRELIVSEEIERCVHYVAAHEMRFSFPVDLIRKNGKLAGNWKERTYPGVHSDVGGGYEPDAQQIDNNFARIPMRDMMSESVSSGVRMMSYDEIKKRHSHLFIERFECKPETEAAYERYLKAGGPAAGTVEEQIKNHLKIYYSAAGTMHRRGMSSAGERSRSASKYKYFVGSKGMAYEVHAYRSLHKVGKWLRLSDSTIRGYAQYIQIQDWQLAAWDATAAEGTVDFVSRFVHDSKVDFMGNIEPFSYFRPRGVEESTVSVWQEGGNWLRSRVSRVRDQTSQALEIAKEKARRAAGATAEAAQEAANAAQRGVTQAAQFARQKANNAAAAANNAYAATAQVAGDAVEVIQEQVDEASTFAIRKAEHAADAAAISAKRNVEAIQRTGERIYESGSNWIRQKTGAAGEFER